MCSYEVSPSGYITSCKQNFKIHYDKNRQNDMPGKIFIKKSFPVKYSYLKVCDDKAPPGYLCYKFVSKTFKNDCLQFAEGLTIDDPNYKGNECVLREKSTQLLLDSKHKDEKNERVNPAIGESYAYVLKDIKHKNEAPYHIAHVLFKDGTTNITLEANAGDKKAKKPKFDMYDTRVKSGATFHDETKRVFYESHIIEKIPVEVDDYVTVVLEKK